MKAILIMFVGLGIAGYGSWLYHGGREEVLPFYLAGGVVLLVGAVMNHRDHTRE